MKINKFTFIGGLIGGLYALIPFLILLNGDGGGDPGPYFIFMFPPFWPVMGTLLFSWLILSIFLLVKVSISQEILFNIIGNIVNILFWIIIGAGLGSIINKKKGGNKWITILTIVILLAFGLTLLYLFK